MTAYYNENDPKAAAWLRELIAEGLIAPGDVDERSIEDVRPTDLVRYTQCHFFAGIGGWSLALRMAGWPDDRLVWTGSCPCQPFSAAGKRKGTADERHLWPAFHWLIAQCQPPIVFGEQVASKAGREWLAGVRADLEALGYAVGAADLCAASVGAPHIRQRLWWVADSDPAGQREQRSGRVLDGERPASGYDADGRGEVCGLGDSHSGGCPERRIHGPGEAQEERSRRPVTGSGDADSGVRHADDAGSQGRGVLPERADERAPWASSLGNWLPCADGKARRIEPGLEPLVTGLPGRVGLLRGYGNSICPQVAQAFIESYIDAVIA